MLKRTIAAVLALVMIIGLLPILPASTTAFAAESGKCGENIYWSFDAGTLTISGYGKMTDYETDKDVPWYSLQDSIERVVFKNVGSGITSIGNSSFDSCDNLTYISVPETLERVGAYAFYMCRKLKDFSLPESVTSIGIYAFAYCESLTKVPSASKLKNVTMLGSDVFSYCKGIKEAVFPPSLKKIPSSLYQDCESLTSVIIPEKVSVVGGSAFRGCTSLKTVVLNCGVTELESYAFRSCTSLENVIICNPLEMSYGVFSGCPSTTNFIIEAFEDSFINNSVIDDDNNSFWTANINFVDSYTVILHPNGGTGGIFGSEGKSVLFSKGATENYTFSTNSQFIPVSDSPFYGWNLKPDGSGRNYLPGDVYTGSEMVNFYAQWSKPQPPERVKRLAGSSRNGTAVEISKEVQKAMEGCDAVVLANGWDFADALAGGPLAKALNAPILLITGDDNDQETYAEIARLGVKDVYILGGNVAVSAAVETQLKQDGYNVERIAGSTRFETAVLIAGYIESIYEQTSKAAVFAYSHNYPDALAVSGIAASAGVPILYIGADGVLDPATKAYVEECRFNSAIILGGTGAISGAAEGNLLAAGAANANRIAGENRYETCLEINKSFSNSLGAQAICVATGANFPDALAGSVLAACFRGATLLVDPTEPLSSEQKEFIETHLDCEYDGRIFLFGGKVAMPEALETELKGFIPQS